MFSMSLSAALYPRAVAFVIPPPVRTASNCWGVKTLPERAPSASVTVLSRKLRTAGMFSTIGWLMVEASSPSETLRYLPVFINWLNLTSTDTGSEATSAPASTTPDTNLPRPEFVFLRDAATPVAPTALADLPIRFEKSRPAEIL